MKYLYCIIYLMFVASILYSQNQGVVVKIYEGDSVKTKLTFIVENHTDKVIRTGILNRSISNRVIFKNQKNIQMPDPFTFVGNIFPDTIEIEPKGTYIWCYDINDYFYPDSRFVPRFYNDKGFYKVIWMFNGVESEPYIFEYK